MADAGGGGVSLLAYITDPYIVVVTGSVWVSTTAMAMLEPCLPIWLMNTIHPEASTQFSKCWRHS
jgi:hypothetical protein